MECRKISNFRDLDIWKLGKEIALDIYEFTKNFPKEELYNLTAQMHQSAISIPSNIAEGFNRYHNKEYKQFLYIALGSCAELETQIEIAFAIGFIDKYLQEKLSEKLNYESRMIRNLVKKL